MSMASTVSGSRRMLSTRATTAYSAITAMTFGAASGAPTPLYHFYQQTMHLSPLLVTVIFGAYVFALMGTLLTVAALSDYVGRRPMILASLVINLVAMGIFIGADAAWELILARVVQGIATGIAITTLGAAIIDTDPRNGSLYNSVTVFLGLMAGALLAGVLLTFAPLPGQLVYIVLLAVMAVEALLLLVLPETNAGRPGALQALRPRVRVPPVAVPVLIRLLPLNTAGWALGGFYLSLMPTLVAVATGIASPFVGAAVVSALMLTAAISVFVLRAVAPHSVLKLAMATLGLGIAVTLAGIFLSSAVVMIVGTVIAGIGFGASFAGSLRALLPLADATDRAGLLSAYFVLSYLAFAVPAILAGLLAPLLGLVATTYLYGAVLIGLVLISFAATRPRRVLPTLEI